MDKTLCEKCVQAKYFNNPLNSVCEICYSIEKHTKKSNSHFREKIEVPECCGKCTYCILPERDICFNPKEFCLASETFNKDDRFISMKFIRKNYLTKGTPKWCPLKEK